MRAVPAHLVAHLLGQAQPENEFDRKLLAAVLDSFKPGKPSGAGDSAEFSAILKHKQVTFEGACRSIEVSESY
jgi:hypothetical protein